MFLVLVFTFQLIGYAFLVLVFWAHCFGVFIVFYCILLYFIAFYCILLLCCLVRIVVSNKNNIIIKLLLLLKYTLKWHCHSYSYQMDTVQNTVAPWRIPDCVRGGRIATQTKSGIRQSHFMFGSRVRVFLGGRSNGAISCWFKSKITAGI